MSVIQLTIGGNTKRSKLGQHAVEINWDELNADVQDFVKRYGLKQYIADGMAGTVNVQDAAAGVAERVRKLVEGDMGRTRTEGSAKADSVEVRALKLARAKVRDTAKVRKVKLEKEQVEAAAKAWFERDPTMFLELAQKELEAEAATRDALEDSEDIFAILGIDQGDDEVEDETDEDESEDDTAE